jgi:putative oxidoreductase
MKFLAPYEPQIRSLLRIVVGFIFLLHGLQKWFGMFGGLGNGMPAPMGSLFWVAGVIETIGGALMMVGLFTRCTAFVLSGQMAVAYFQAHFPRGINPILNGGEPAVLYSFIFLWFASAGAGPIRADAARGKD